MYQERPPRICPRALIFLLLTSAAGRQLFSQPLGLILPDMVAPKRSRADIELPVLTGDPSVGWYPEDPRYRRVYPLAVTFGREYPVPVPPFYEVGAEFEARTNFAFLSNTPGDDRSVPAVPAAPAVVRATTTVPAPIPVMPRTAVQAQLPLRKWIAGASTDIAEGIGAFFLHELGDVNKREKRRSLGYFGGGFFVPFDYSESALRSYSSFAAWRRSGTFEADVVVMLKGNASGDAMALTSADLSLDRGLDKPDDYSLRIISLAGSSDEGTDTREPVSFQFGAGFDIPIGSSLSLYLESDAGVWDSRGSGGLIRAAAALGWMPEDSALTLSAGIDSVYDNYERLQLAPYYRAEWRRWAFWTLYLDGGFQIGFPSEFVSAMRDEFVVNFDPVLPVNRYYRAGARTALNDGSGFSFDFVYRDGRFSLGDGERTILIVPDRRFESEVGATIALTESSLVIDGRIDWSLDSHPILWDASLAYRRYFWEVFVRGGSEDAVLASGLPGIRGDESIMAIGGRLIAAKAWEFSTMGYSRLATGDFSLRFGVRCSME